MARSQRRRRHTPEQIIRKLREGEKLLGQGAEQLEVLKHLEITELRAYGSRSPLASRPFPITSSGGLTMIIVSKPSAEATR